GAGISLAKQASSTSRSYGSWMTGPEAFSQPSTIGSPYTRRSRESSQFTVSRLIQEASFDEDRQGWSHGLAGKPTDSALTADISVVPAAQHEDRPESVAHVHVRDSVAANP